MAVWKFGKLENSNSVSRERELERERNMKFISLLLITLCYLGESAFAVPSNFEALVRDAAQPLLDKYALKYVGVRSSGGFNTQQSLSL